ncbi:MAG: cob(I)yrinic acid a,c-diamide adenosyltransferase [Pontiellaceae bacterium]|nr:cob(I)yrinic acid a,c-diamide adenosyltransferase [Pontiellaceae bacterium]MBN2786443.1 cob(I)yrinic acid a,c-diamide adenosyltransferase [Pontiellaceae bacterium]
MPKIYTKTGDKGETGRFDGTRVPKNDPVIEVNGTIDECNSFIGLARSYIEDEQVSAFLRTVQSQLIVAGSEVTNVSHDERLPFITKEEITVMETLINELEQGLEPLTHFILPAGGQASAHLHVARTVARKVERRLVALRESVELNPVLLAYFNRLADTLFVLARHVAKLDGQGDEIWINPKKQA